MFVVDASMALTWCIEDEATPEADAVLHRLLLESGIAPAHWPLELANALRSAERTGRIDEAALDRARTIILELPVDIRPVETSTALGLIGTARRHGLTAYDAAYLDLARVRGLGVATLDDTLARACRAENVDVIEG